jgi:DNA (cytosine-5)-methyltransferase 1
LNYYNDNDPGVCDWLENLIAAGRLPDGVVDRRSILEVTPADLAPFTQCHFFAGIGGWPLALQLAGIPETARLWTGSPPCQPFSAAGQRKGQDDARHLAPHFAELVSTCRPPLLFGEQVASSDVFGKVAGGARGGARDKPAWAWIDDLSDRLEAAHYAVGASDIPAAGVGAPHIRQRTFFGAVALWVDNSAGARHEPAREGAEGEARDETRMRGPERGCGAIGLADAERARPQGRGGAERGGIKASGQAPTRGAGIGLANAERRRREVALQHDGSGNAPDVFGEAGEPRSVGFSARPRPLDDPWRDADWLFCRDGKWRPVEPGTFPLAHGVSGRVVRLRAYGNAIVPQAAAAFIRSFVTALAMTHL